MASGQNLGPDGAAAPLRSVRDALRECRLLIIFTAVFGVAVNLLLLTGPLYMLQIYDRVIASGSLPTLLALTLLMVAAYAALGLIDYARASVAGKVGLRLERLIAERLVRSAWSRPSGASLSRGSDLLRDLDTYRGFIGGQALIIATDLPFTPLFVAVVFLLHPWLGGFALLAIVMLGSIALAARVLTRRRLEEAQERAQSNARFVLNVATASEAVRAMGMGGALAGRWRNERDELVGKMAVASERAASFKSTTKASRFAVQSLILGIGAYLVLQNELTPGGMIAASIILGRALAPIEQALASWSQFGAARTARVNLDAALAEAAEDFGGARAAMPPLSGEVSFDRLTYTPPGANQPIFSDVSIRVPAGAAVGVIGPSGAGKSTIARLLVGVLRPSFGCVRIDGGDVRQYDPERLGREIGFLPQEVGLLDGTVAENIARFELNREEEIFEAARKARVHDLIQRLPQGYQTRIGPSGMPLSSGQRQRVGLARALFGAPKVIVLDEPNANLDDVGEAALLDALEEVSKSGATVFLITHKMALLENVRALLVLNADRSVMYGPRDAVLERLQRKSAGGPPRRLPPAQGGAQAEASAAAQSRASDPRASDPRASDPRAADARPGHPSGGQPSVAPKSGGPEERND